jgi:hypothetical protein
MSAILWCGIGRVVFAASIDELAPKLGQIMLTSRAVADAAPFATIAITGGGPFRRGAGAVYGGSVTSGSATRFVGVYSGRMASCDPLAPN